MKRRNESRARVQETDVLYVRANERIAKGVALAGAYLIWIVLGIIAVGLLLLAL